MFLVKSAYPISVARVRPPSACTAAAGLLPGPKRPTQPKFKGMWKSREMHVWGKLSIEIEPKSPIE